MSFNSLSVTWAIRDIQTDIFWFQEPVLRHRWPLLATWSLSVTRLALL